VSATEDRAATALIATLGFDEEQARAELAGLPENELQAVQGAAARLSRVADGVRIDRAMARLRELS
jgi:hypothetical protein